MKGDIKIIIEIDKKYYPNTNTYVRRALCKCFCGNTFESNYWDAKNGKRVSCGCYTECYKRERPHIERTLQEKQLYNIWFGIKRRCYNPDFHDYKYYGAIGIKVCEEWRNSFKTFYTWAIANKWEKGLHIDRYPNKDGNYEPDNCRIVPQILNINNRKNNIVITHEGKTLTLSQWAASLNIPYWVLYTMHKEGDIDFAKATKYKPRYNKKQ